MNMQFKTETHIIPMDDLDVHCDFGTSCKCMPTIERYGVHALIIHNSFDGREYLERTGAVTRYREKGV